MVFKINTPLILHHRNIPKSLAIGGMGLLKKKEEKKERKRKKGEKKGEKNDDSSMC